MIGFIVGTLCLVGLVKVARGGFGRRRFAYAGGCHGGYGGHQGAPGPSFRGFGGPWSIFEQLGLTRDQAKAFRGLKEEWIDAAFAARKSVQVVKNDVASALRTDSFDETLVGESLARFDEVTDAFKKSMLTSLAKAHQVLDARQRERLAELLEDGGLFRGRRGW